MKLERVLMAKTGLNYVQARTIARRARENLSLDPKLAWSQELEAECFQICGCGEANVHNDSIEKILNDSTSAAVASEPLPGLQAARLNADASLNKELTSAKKQSTTCKVQIFGLPSTPLDTDDGGDQLREEEGSSNQEESVVNDDEDSLDEYDIAKDGWHAGEKISPLVPSKPSVGKETLEALEGSKDHIFKRPMRTVSARKDCDEEKANVVANRPSRDGDDSSDSDSSKGSSSSNFSAPPMPRILPFRRTDAYEVSPFRVNKKFVPR
jgi:hypothetical protein